MHRAAALAALALAACTAEGPEPAPSPTASPTPTTPPDEPLLLAAYGRNDELIRLCGTSLGGQPALAASLLRYLLAHQSELRARLTTAPAPLPGQPAKQPLPAVVRTLRQISADDLAAAGKAADPANALLLAEIAASRAQHAVLLGRAR